MGDAASSVRATTGRDRRDAGARPPGDARGRDRLLDVAARRPRRRGRARGAVQSRRAGRDRRARAPCSRSSSAARSSSFRAASARATATRIARSSSTCTACSGRPVELNLLLPTPHNPMSWERTLEFAREAFGAGRAPAPAVHHQRARPAPEARRHLRLRRDAGVARRADAHRAGAIAPAAATRTFAPVWPRSSTRPDAPAAFTWDVLEVEAVRDPEHAGLGRQARRRARRDARLPAARHVSRLLAGGGPGDAVADPAKRARAARSSRTSCAPA